MPKLKRTPNAIVVNGAYLRVKDPSAAAGSFFGTYVTVPGLANFTMPAEAGATTDTALMDGSISAPQFAGVGTITGSIGARTAHPAHQFLEQRKIDQEDITIEILKHAVPVVSVDVAAAGSIVDGGGLDELVLATLGADRARQNILNGHIVHVWASDDIAADGPDDGGRSFLLYGAAATAENDKQWRSIPSVVLDDAGAPMGVKVVPHFSAAIAVPGNKSGRITVRNGGLRWTDLNVKVNQFDQGDFQAGGNVSSNVTFTPSVSVPAAIVEHRLDTGITK